MNNSQFRLSMIFALAIAFTGNSVANAQATSSKISPDAAAAPPTST